MMIGEVRWEPLVSTAIEVVLECRKRKREVMRSKIELNSWISSSYIFVGIKSSKKWHEKADK